MFRRTLDKVKYDEFYDSGAILAEFALLPFDKMFTIHCRDLKIKFCSYREYRFFRESFYKFVHDTLCRVKEEIPLTAYTEKPVGLKEGVALKVKEEK